MSIRAAYRAAYGVLAGTAALLALTSPAPAQGLTMQECSVKYRAAKDAGALKGTTWNEFRKTECSADAAAAPPPPSPRARTAAPTAAPGAGLTMKECSARYQAAKGAGNLGGRTWNEFRKAECSADADAASATPPAKTTTRTNAPAPSAGAPATSGLSMQECSDLYQTAKSSGDLLNRTWNEFRKIECSAEAAAALREGRAVAGPGTSANAVFPRALSPKYANESAGKARMHTCLDQYLANKASNGNAGLRWIEKGGGYYSECNRRLSQQ